MKNILLTFLLCSMCFATPISIDKPNFLGITLKHIDLEENLSGKYQNNFVNIIMNQQNTPFLSAAIGKGVKVYNTNWRGTTFQLFMALVLFVFMILIY